MTTYSTTTLQRFQDALLAHLNDPTLHPALKDVLICDGIPPVSYLTAGEVVWFGDVKGLQNWAAIANPRRPKDETYTIDCSISVIGATVPNDPNGQGPLTDRVLTIFAEIEQELRTNPTQGIEPLSGNETGGYVKSSEITSMDLTKRANDTSRESAIQFQIEAHARL